MSINAEHLGPNLSYPNSGMFRPCSMTVFFHDYANRLIPIQIYSTWTLELIRGMTNEQIGKTVRDTLNKLEEAKSNIENK